MSANLSGSHDLNVLGTPLIACSYDPLTGYFRNGCCTTDEHDQGSHVICALVNQEFLNFSKSRGNDLLTPRPAYRFSGLKPGARWCLCARRWLEAFEAGVAPAVVLVSTHANALAFATLDQLKSCAHASLQ